MSSKWVFDPNHGGQKSQPPRYLTPQEVDRIVNSFPQVKAIDDKTAQVVRTNFMTEVRRQLMKIKLVPNEAALQKLIDTIAERYHLSTIARGKSIGIESADALGKGATQMELNLFHFAGQGSTVSAGLKSLTQLLYATSNRGSKEMCIVHFRPKVNARDVYDMMIPVVEKFVADFISSKEIYINPGPGCIPNTTYVLEKKYWNHLWEFTSNSPYPTSQHVLRITLNKIEMYKHRVTVKTLADIIKGSDPIIDVMYSTLEDATIDIFPNEKLIRDGMDDSHANIKSPSKLFLNTTVEPLLKTTRVKGIKGIKSIKPIEVKTMNVFKPASLVNKLEIEYNNLFSSPSLGDTSKLDLKTIARRTWSVPVDVYLLMSSHVSIADAHALAKSTGCVLIKADDRNIGSVMETYYYYVPEDGISFNDYVNRCISKSDHEAIKRAATHTYASTEGSNLKGLQALPWVDKTKTVCNNMHVMTDLLGVEIAMMYLIYEIMEILNSSGIDIDQRHVTLVAEFMFNRGIPLGVTYAGISRQRDDYMSMASIQRAWRVLTENAPYDKVDCANNVGTSTVLGIPPSIGSNCYRLLPDQEAVKVMRERQRKKEEIANMIKNGYTIDQEIIEAELAQQQKSVKLEDVINTIPTDNKRQKEPKPSLLSSLPKLQKIEAPTQTNTTVADKLEQGHDIFSDSFDASSIMVHNKTSSAVVSDDDQDGVFVDDMFSDVTPTTSNWFDTNIAADEVEAVKAQMSNMSVTTPYQLPDLSGVSSTPSSPYQLKHAPYDVFGYQDI